MSIAKKFPASPSIEHGWHEMTAKPGMHPLAPAKPEAIKVNKAHEDTHYGRSTADDARERVGIVIPTINEGPNLARLVPELEDVFSKHDIDGHLFIVDDGSSDGTVDLVRGLAATYQNINFIQRPSKLGIGSAYRTGFRHALDAGMNVIFEMDADLSHRPSYILSFLEYMRDHDVGLVVGSRYCKSGTTTGWPPKRRLISFIANVFTQLALGIGRIHDMTSGFRAYSAKTLKSIDFGGLETNGFAWQVETLYKTRLVNHEVREIPIVFYERKAGESKLSIDDIKEFIVFLTKALVARVGRVFH